MPSPNDFSAITELMDVKKLYEEQEEKWRLRLQEKEDLIAQLEQEIRDRERMVEARMQQQADVEGEVGRMRQENERVKQEAAARIAQLNDRIRELNQRLMGAGGAAAAPAPAPQPPSGFFKR